MAIDTTDIKTLYRELLAESLEQLKNLQADVQMEDVTFSNVAASIIANTLQSAPSAYDVLKRADLIDIQKTEASEKWAINKQIMENQKTEASEKWAINKQIMENQKATSDKDLENKDAMIANSLAQQQKTIDSMQTDIDYNISKKEIMIATRKDNIRMRATSEYGEFLKYISAANAVPAKFHFTNLIGLVEGIEKGIADPDYSYTMINNTTDPDTVAVP